MHETIPLQIPDPFIELFDVGHTSSRLGSNARFTGRMLSLSCRLSRNLPIINHTDPS